MKYIVYCNKILLKWIITYYLIFNFIIFLMLRANVNLSRLGKSVKWRLYLFSKHLNFDMINVSNKIDTFFDNYIKLFKIFNVFYNNSSVNFFFLNVDIHMYLNMLYNIDIIEYDADNYRYIYYFIFKKYSSKIYLNKKKTKNKVLYSSFLPNNNFEKFSFFFFSTYLKINRLFHFCGFPAYILHNIFSYVRDIKFILFVFNFNNLTARNVCSFLINRLYSGSNIFSAIKSFIASSYYYSYFFGLRIDVFGRIMKKKRSVNIKFKLNNIINFSNVNSFIDFNRDVIILKNGSCSVRCWVFKDNNFLNNLSVYLNDI